MGFRARSIPPPGQPGTFWLVSTQVAVYETQPATIVLQRGGAAQGAATISGTITGLFDPPKAFSVTWADGEDGVKSAIVATEGALVGTGMIQLDTGTGPAGAVFGVTSGTLTVNELPDTADAQADWELRSRADGVFWACNGEEWVRGMPGYVTQPVKDYPAGIPGRLVTTISSIAEQPSGEASTLPNPKWTGDIGDGAGVWRHTAYPNVSGKVMHVRAGSARKDDYVNNTSDYNVIPWAYAPLDFRDAERGTGLPNERRGIKGTVGEGQILPFVETRIDNPALVSGNNPSNRPMVREHFVQFLLCPFEDWYLYMNRMYYTPPWATGLAQGDRDNKILFATGGQSGDQFALKLQATFIVSTMGYRGDSTVGYGRTVTVKGKEKIDLHHTAIDMGGAALTSANRAEDWMRRYGPALRAFIDCNGVYPDGVNRARQVWSWRHPAHPDLEAKGLTYLQANRLSAPDKNYPYGGFPTDGRPPFPDLDLPRECLAGVMRSNTPMVIQYMISDQISAPINQDATIPAKDDPWREAAFPRGPRITALWASKLGDPPTLLGYVGSNGSNGPAMIPSRVFHRGSGNLETTNADDGVLFKIQENAIDEDRANCGYMILGALDGFPEPTTREFYALRANPDGNLRGPYVSKPTNKAVDPGTVENFGAGYGMGWAKGELNTLDKPATTKQPWQFRIERTWYTGQNRTVPNAYRSDLAPVSAPVHKFRLAQDTSVVPRARSEGYAGDCINVIFQSEDQRPYGRQLGYGEIIFSLKPPPWPRHPTAALPWPEEWTP